MWYLIAGLLSVLLIWKDSNGRNTGIVKYSVLSVLFPFFGYSLWQAEKPLKGDEKRYGGKGWNLMKWCAIMHTVMCFVWGVYGMVAGAEVASEAGSRAGEVGAAIGTGIGMMMIAFVWFGGVVGCLLLGVILKKPVEESAAAAV